MSRLDPTAAGSLSSRAMERLPTDPPSGVSSWCEISRDALRHNCRIFRSRLAPGARLGMVVKSDAYGHGLVGCARTFLEAGADWLVVNTVDEALALRRAEVEAPLYVCGPTLADRAWDMAEARARVVVYDADLVEALDATGRGAGEPVPVHVKVETGNNRQGLALEEAVALGRRIRDLPGVTLEGLSTHYADIEDTTDHRFALGQLEAFEAARQAFADAGLDVPVAHSANSAATILWPETHGDLVRVGVAAYGLWPSTETYVTAIQIEAHGKPGFPPQLRTALSWRCRIAQVKDVQPGDYVGYGRTFRATHPMRIAILPVGYFEGYDRRLSNLAHVLVDGQRAPVRGRICMNMTMVDVTHVPGARRGSVATLLGDDGDEVVSADLLASWMGTINYEVVSRIHPDQPRRFA
ncbi:MAG: alanine racemase [Myxococcota bacterium]